MTPSLSESVSGNPQEVPGVLDIEASGFGRNSYPIEIGYVLPDGEIYCSLVRPAPTWTHWDASAERVHRIDPRTLAEHGRDAIEVARHLNSRLRGLTLYCDGWAHDFPWLAMLFDEAGLVPTFRLETLRKLLSEREADAWERVKNEVSGELDLQRHRASADARILRDTLVRLWAGSARLTTPA